MELAILPYGFSTSFIMNDKNDQDVLSLTSKGIRATIIGIIANVFLAGTKAISGILGNSTALLADAVESLTDILSLIVVYSGIRIAATPPDKNHPYGHGKADPLAAMVVSFTLAVIAVGIAIQSIREILKPQYVPESFTLIVLVVIVITKESLYRYVSRVGKDTGSTVVKSGAWDHRCDALTSLSAFIGISIARIGGQRFAAADDWAALVVSAFILFNAFRLFRPALGEVMDTAPGTGIEAQIRKAAQGVEGVAGLDTCNIRKMGVTLYVDLHVEVDGNLSVRRGHEIAHEVKETIKKSNPSVYDVLVHVEPGTLLDKRTK